MDREARIVEACAHLHCEDAFWYQFTHPTSGDAYAEEALGTSLDEEFCDT